MLSWLKDFLSPNDLTIINFGDSLTYRFENASSHLLTLKLKQMLPEINWINSGVNGNTILQAKERFERDVLSHHPDIVTFMFGSNDASMDRNVPVEAYRRTLNEMIEILGKERVILITPPPVDESKQMGKRTNERINWYRQVVLEIGREQKIPVIDLYNVFYEHSDFPNILKGKKDDGLHFGESGYNLYAASIVKMLKTQFLK
ncbi:SGNH/GDSL hydrolase family protein [Atopobacter phocae]|uniref:SGNH/GDSL hydrolase family protein n=1 Tax=Atopobacter phocae TaxID=136492 RepID=UPI00046F3FBF|nr:GDSL-type esterase/lipase family protein [Atopobacter phocae]